MRQRSLAPPPPTDVSTGGLTFDCCYALIGAETVSWWLLLDAALEGSVLRLGLKP